MLTLKGTVHSKTISLYFGSLLILYQQNGVYQQSNFQDFSPEQQKKTVGMMMHFAS
jgi:hypothetical protein